MVAADATATQPDATMPHSLKHNTAMEHDGWQTKEQGSRKVQAAAWTRLSLASHRKLNPAMHRELDTVVITLQYACMKTCQQMQRHARSKYDMSDAQKIHVQGTACQKSVEAPTCRHSAGP